MQYFIFNHSFDGFVILFISNLFKYSADTSVAHGYTGQALVQLLQNIKLKKFHESMMNNRVIILSCFILRVNLINVIRIYK